MLISCPHPKSCYDIGLSENYILSFTNLNKVLTKLGISRKTKQLEFSYTAGGSMKYHAFLLLLGTKSLLFNIYTIALGFPHSSVGKEWACNAGDPGTIPGSGWSAEGKGYPLQYSGLENSMDYKVHGVAKSQTQLSEFHNYWGS